MAEEKKWMQKAAKRMKKKGTSGSFTKWCKGKGLVSSEGKPTCACVSAGLKAGGKIAKKASFAKAVKGC